MTSQSTIPSIAPAPAGPPLDIPLFRGSRPLKRWRYVAVFCDELMACAALVQIGPARQSFWALYMREEKLMRERTRLLPRRGEVELDHGRAATRTLPATPGRLRVHGRGVLLDLQMEEQAGIEALCPNGRAQVWTRKQAGVAAHGTLQIDGGPAREVHALAVIDDTIGHHTRHTEWHWSAGVGEGPGGIPLAWNLVSGVNDPPQGSERAVWVAGSPTEAAPVSFAADLSSIRCEQDGAELRFLAEAQRSRHDELLIVGSTYRAPFGSFSGRLPGGIPLAHGLGIVEHHRARW